jgi:tRNA (cmo5U34)-methyltransferase
VSEENTSLGHLPDQRWAFDAEVTRVFEDMLRRSIPQLEVMRETVRDLAVRYAVPGTTIVDLGASRGDAVAPLVALEPRLDVHFDLCEVSPPMVAVCRERFAREPRVSVHETDLRHGYPDLARSASVTLCVLALQFTPIQHRMRILRDAWRRTLPGGALILVEKVLGSDAEADAALVELYHGLKVRNGYTREEVDRKAASLEGVLVPVTARWNEELLHAAGFGTVECVWRCLSFGAWLAVRS